MEFAAATLIGIDDSGQTCVNGLPIAPSPTRMLSRFWKIAELNHENLCKYLELIRCQTVTNGVILISEHYEQKYLNELRQKEELDTRLAYRVAQQICTAINYCHDNRVIIGFLTLENVFLHQIKKQLCVKLTQYGLYHISGQNEDVDYVVGSAWYLSPERLLLNSSTHNKNKFSGLATFKSDIWSFGILLLEIFTRKLLSKIWGIKQILSVLSSVIKKAEKKSALIPLLEAMQFACPNLKILMPKKVLEIIDSCLQIFPSKRPSAATLLNLLTNITESSTNITTRSSNGLDESLKRINAEDSLKQWFNRPLKELFFLWKLCGSSVESILVGKGVIRMKPPICTIPCLVVDDNQIFGNEEARKVYTSFHLCVLPSKNLKNRLKSIYFGDYYYSMELDNELAKHSFAKNFFKNREVVQEQTLIVKERDIDYQVFRMGLFSKLLAAYPYNADILRAEAKKDIPPLYRGAVWAALLNVFKDEAQDEFCRLNIISEHVSDRQLQVDIPRCHQYDELMTSSVAHYKLKILLKSWLISQTKKNTCYVYWQGLDSLAAPFLILHFNDIAIAFGCLSEFIERYLHNFFLQDNSETIQGYLAVFMLLVEFIDPDLSAHLQALDFPPQLFAIPWFLTCFAHVLPLQKLFHLWDALLLADATFPLFIGVAILKQLRPQLIKAQFNEAILLFSDLPDLVIDNIVSDTNDFYNSVPSSCTHKDHLARHCLPNLRSILIQLLASSASTSPSVTEALALQKT